MEFQPELAHRAFAAQAFNAAWDHMEALDNDLMLLAAAHASRWHWAHVPEEGDRERSIGLWQCSRAYALLNEPSMARRMAQACLEMSKGLLPFFLGFAHEAMARAEWLCGNEALARQHLCEAERLLDHVEDSDDQAILGDDLRALSSMITTAAP